MKRNNNKNVIKVYGVRCAIWYHLYNLKHVKNTHEGVLILVKLQAEACNFTKINTPPWAFFTFFKLYKWYQIAQRITYANIYSTCILHSKLASLTRDVTCFKLQRYGENLNARKLSVKNSPNSIEKYIYFSKLIRLQTSYC